ncbi:hypothetical protein SALBM311S_10743 [Streptomyces alboniger]
MHGLREIIVDPDSDLVDQVRCVSALFTMHARGCSCSRTWNATPEEKRKAVLDAGHGPGDPGARGRLKGLGDGPRPRAIRAAPGRSQTWTPLACRN